MKASSAVGYLVDETAHEMDGDFVTMDTTGQGAGGPRAGRLRMETRGAKLFDGISFSLHGTFNKPTRAELVKLLTLGGAAVVERLPDVARPGTGAGFIVVSDQDPPSTALAESCMQLGIPPPVNSLWILNCISRYAVEEH